jgi:hypothetical protein
LEMIKKKVNSNLLSICVYNSLWYETFVVLRKEYTGMGRHKLTEMEERPTWGSRTWWETITPTQLELAQKWGGGRMYSGRGSDRLEDWLMDRVRDHLT